MKRCFFILLVCMAASCSSLKDAKQVGRLAADVITPLDESEEKPFYYYFYQAARLDEQALDDQAVEALLFCQAIRPDDPGVNAALGNFYTRLGMLAEGEACFEKAVKGDPENWWYNMGLINLLTGQNKLSRAVERASFLQKAYPYKEESYYTLASLYAQTGQLSKAAETYNVLERMVGINESLSLEKFRLYAYSGQNKKAVGEIDRLIEAFPNESRYRVMRGDIYMQQGQPDRALALYEAVLDDDPQNPYVYLSLSDYYKAVGQPDKAMDMIVSALHNDRLDVGTKMNILGKYIENLLADKKKIDETEKLFKMLVENYPLEEQVHAYYATFLQYQGRKEEMLDELEALTYINPSNEGAWVQRLQTYLADGQPEQVLALSEQALLSLPDAANLRFFTALAKMQCGDLEGALVTAKEALALFDEGKANNRILHASIYTQVGDLCYQLDLPEEAFAAYENALRLNPGNVYTMNNYAYYLSLAGRDLRRAETMSAKTVEAEPTNSTFLDTYAWILYKQGSYTLAKFYIERAIDHLDPEEDNAVIYDHYGDILWECDEKEKAVDMWIKAQEGGIDTSAKIEAARQKEAVPSPRQ